MTEKKVILKVASPNKLREVRGETQWTRLIAEENAEKAKNSPKVAQHNASAASVSTIKFPVRHG